MATDLSKSLGVLRGTAILLNIVIGAGLLTLPGLAVATAGGAAPLAWALCGAAALPLVGVFIVLGRRYPEAGGLSAYAGRAFGPLGARMASFLFLGAVVFGLPAIALSGGHYVASLTGGPPAAFALALLLGAVGPHCLPGESAARSMALVASAVLVAILVFLAIGAFGIVTGAAVPGPRLSLALAPALAPFSMLFFAFTGWEVGAGIAEEFERPARDFPLAMLLSFAVTAALYLAVALVVAETDLGQAFATPFVAIVRPVLGPWGAAAVAVTAALIVFANLSGAIWGVSRLVFGLARDGTAPRALATLTGGRPLRAVLATVAALVVVLAASAAGAIDLPLMLSLAGQNFLLLYGFAAAALLRLARSGWERALSLLTLVLVVTLMSIDGVKLLYPLALVVLAVVIDVASTGRSRLGRPAMGRVRG